MTQRRFIVAALPVSVLGHVQVELATQPKLTSQRIEAPDHRPALLVRSGGEPAPTLDGL